MGQGVVHVIRTHLVQGGIPDSVLFREQVCQELRRRQRRAVKMRLMPNLHTFADLMDLFLLSPQVTRTVHVNNSASPPKPQAELSLNFQFFRQNNVDLAL